MGKPHCQEQRQQAKQNGACQYCQGAQYSDRRRLLALRRHSFCNKGDGGADKADDDKIHQPCQRRGDTDSGKRHSPGFRHYQSFTDAHERLQGKSDRKRSGSPDDQFIFVSMAKLATHHSATSRVFGRSGNQAREVLSLAHKPASSRCLCVLFRQCIANAIYDLRHQLFEDFRCRRQV